MDVDTAVTVPVNLLPLLDDTDFKSIEIDVAYNAAGMALTWHFVTTAGVITATAVTPTTAGDYDWAEDLADKGTYKIEIPASGGVSINNDTEGFGWFTGVATGVLPWRGPVIGFRAAALNNALIDGATIDVNVTAISGDTTAADNCELMFDGTGYAGGTAKLGVDVVAVSGDTTAADNAELMFDGTGYAGGTTKLGVNVVSQDNIDFGALQKTSLNAATPASVTGAVGSVTSAVTVGTNNDKTGYALSAAGVQAIWDALTAALTTVSSIGKLLVDNINATISSRAATGAQMDLVNAPNATAVTAIQSGLAVEANVEGHVTTALNSYDPPTKAELDVVGAYIDTEVAAILADTGELQTDLTNGGRLDLLIDAIKAKTDNLPASPAAVGSAMTLANGAVTAAVVATDAIDADALAADAANKIADHTLRRTFANARASANGDAASFRSLLGAIAKLVNKVSISGSTLTVCQEDDTTSLGTQTITESAGANPISALDTDG